MLKKDKHGDYDNSTPAIMFTLILFCLYFMFIKPVVKIETLDNPEAYNKIITNGYASSAILLFLTILIQLIFNTWSFQVKCPGSFLKNFGYVFSATFIPWFIIFGSVVVALIAFPGFKGAFSNVFGYYAVANSSNNILVKLLGMKEVEEKLQETTDEHERAKLETASDAILKMLGNTGLMINQVTPSTFGSFWKMLVPIMKTEYQDPSANMEMKKQLLDNVVLKDNIGEAVWYIYTMILLTTVVQTRVADIPCATSVASLQENAAKIRKEKETRDKLKAKRDKMVYRG